MVTQAPTPFRSVRRDASLSDKVVGQLTEAIVSQQLAPGQRLPSERELGEQFGVSRTVIREAIRSLAARGLVSVTSGRGIEVGQVGSGDVTASMRLFVRGHKDLHYGKVHEVRTAVELQTAGLAAARATPDDIARLRELCDGYQRAIEAGDLPGASELDFQFHQELAKASGNELLVAMLESISDVLREVRNQALEVVAREIRIPRSRVNVFADLAREDIEARFVLDVELQYPRRAVLLGDRIGEHALQVISQPSERIRRHRLGTHRRDLEQRAHAHAVLEQEGLAFRVVFDPGQQVGKRVGTVI